MIHTLNNIKNKLLYDILDILLYLQKKLKFCHGDLKPANIFMNKKNDYNIDKLSNKDKKDFFIDEYNVKLGDFDKSRLIWENGGIKYHIANFSAPYEHFKFMFNKKKYSNKHKLSSMPLKSVLIARHKNDEEAICSYFDISCIIIYFIINSAYHYNFFLNMHWNDITTKFFLKEKNIEYTQLKFKKLIDILIQKTNKNKKSINLVFNFVSINNIYITSDNTLICYLMSLIKTPNNMYRNANTNLIGLQNINYMKI